jgi:perosamine synthetase
VHKSIVKAGHPVSASRIALASPDLTGNEEKYVVEAIRSSWISSTGAFISRFENEFAAACGTRACLSVSNGTVALHVALLALGVGVEEEVIVPALTYVATANAVKYVGAVPIFVDVDPQTWCIDCSKIEAAITDRTRGIIAVHLYGHPADMDQINKIAAKHNLWVVEDAAEAHFANYKGRPTGGLAKIGTFSFYGNKIITSGEGGAVTVSDPELEIRMRMFRGQGMDPQRRYYFPITGYNFRLTNIACAILCAQLERRHELVQRRRQIYSLYRDSLRCIPGIDMQPVAEWAEISPWLFCMTINEKIFGRSRDEVIAELEVQGIESRPLFVPLHTLPPFTQQSRARAGELPVTEKLGNSGISLPTSSTITPDLVARVVKAIQYIAKSVPVR